jgi:CSLREA domain-containing protein
LSVPALAHAATTITVDTTADDTTTDGHCSLREAVGVANGTGTTDCVAAAGAPVTIQFDETLFATAQTITLATADNPITISASVTVSGPSAAKLILDGGNQTTIFKIMGSPTVMLSHMTVQHSKYQMSTTLTAAIYNQGTLSVDHVLFLNNDGGGGNAGAINTTGQLTVTNTLFESNHAGLAGAVVVNNAAPRATFVRCTFEANSATSGGAGALFVDNYAPVEIYASVFHANTATMGGGAAVLNNEATLLDVAFDANTAGGFGGALLIQATGSKATWIERASFTNNASSSDGGAIYWNNGAHGTLTNVTFSGNQADTTVGKGGAFSGYGNELLSLNNVTITGNGANRGGGIDYEGTTLTIRNSILSGNTASGTGNATSPDCYTGGGSGSITSSDYNFFGDLAHCTVDSANHDKVGEALLLGSAANNGGAVLGPDAQGRVRTVAPLAGSPVIDSGNPAGCAVDAFTNQATPTEFTGITAAAGLDARQLSRPVGKCDCGALETRCGDSTVDTGEECVDGNNGDDTDACLRGCKSATCGDGHVQDGVEECDDGNTADGDGCSASCEDETSGGSGGSGGSDAGGADAGGADGGGADAGGTGHHGSGGHGGVTQFFDAGGGTSAGGGEPSATDAGTGMSGSAGKGEPGGGKGTDEKGDTDGGMSSGKSSSDSGCGCTVAGAERHADLKAWLALAFAAGTMLRGLRRRAGAVNRNCGSDT